MAFSIRSADSPVDSALADRYRSGYEAARLLQSAGKILMYWVCWIYGLFRLLGPAISVHSFERYSGSLTSLTFGSLVPAIYDTLFTWMMGLLLLGVGHMLAGILDIAINSSPSPELSQ